MRDVRKLLHSARLLIDEMGLDAERVLASYQHELSGGMRQRVGIVLALVLNAHVLILDEPTTALDTLTQASVLEIVRKVHAERHLTTLVISHDMGVVGDLADRMAVDVRRPDRRGRPHGRGARQPEATSAPAGR